MDLKAPIYILQQYSYKPFLAWLSKAVYTSLEVV